MKGFKQSPEELEEFMDFIEDDMENIERVLSEVMEEDVEFMIHGKAETVEESAQNTDMEKGDIIKTLVFMAERPVAVLCPGDTSVSEEKLAEKVDSKVRMASPEEVKEETGYIIGGVSPFDLDIDVFMEESILDKDKVKPAGGSRVVGVSIDPEALKRISEAELIDVSRN